MLYQRLRRWPSIKSTWCRHFVQGINLRERGQVRSAPGVWSINTNICAMLDQRRGRWADVVQMFFK